MKEAYDAFQVDFLVCFSAIDWVKWGHSTVLGEDVVSTMCLPAEKGLFRVVQGIIHPQNNIQQTLNEHFVMKNSHLPIQFNSKFEFLTLKLCFMDEPWTFRLIFAK